MVLVYKLNQSKRTTVTWQNNSYVVKNEGYLNSSNLLENKQELAWQNVVSTVANL
jgi:hypothetical protein